MDKWKELKEIVIQELGSAIKDYQKAEKTSKITKNSESSELALEKGHMNAYNNILNIMSKLEEKEEEIDDE